jgi:predicted secreted acid phosphatase
MNQFKTQVMKKALHISAALDQPELLENMVEKLAYRRYEMGYGKEKMPKGWEADETSSTEAYVSGTVEFSYNEDEKIRMPFITCFLFTCAHGNKEPYKLNWSMSLS